MKKSAGFAPTNETPGDKKKADKGAVKKQKTVTVPVPMGCKAGDTIKLSVYGQKIKATIPEGVEEGELFKIVAPERDEGAERYARKVTVEIPAGSEEGQILTFKDGKGAKCKELSVVIPKGKTGGDSLTLTLYENYDKTSKRKGKKK